MSKILPRRDYRVLKTELPFIASPHHYIHKHRVRRHGCLWHVHCIDDYERACTIGREYAVHFAQYLKDNPEIVGQNLLGRIATDMNFHDNTARRGYWIGFFSYLERLIHELAVQRQLFSDLDRFNASLTTACR